MFLFPNAFNICPFFTHFYTALVIELDGSVIISTDDGDEFISGMKELSPEINTKLVRNSKVFTVVAGASRRMHIICLNVPSYK